MNQVTAWQQITDQISEGLAVYVLYSAGLMAADIIDGLLTVMKHDEYLSDDTLHSIYTDLTYGQAAAVFQDHLENDDDQEPVEISTQALEEGMEVLIQWMDLMNADDAMAYLRYVLDWEENHFDWLGEHPKSLDEFLVGNKQ